MRAIAITDFMLTPQLMDLPRPQPGADEVLVRLYAAGLNPVDWKIAEGMLSDGVRHHFPLVLGTDGAGVVDAVGPAVTAFRPGDEVYGQFQDVGRGLGSYAEYGLFVQGAPVARMPRGMTFTQAAAVPVATMTGYNLVETTKVDQGQTVLVSGASGGVGQQAVQFAVLQGARVIATATADIAEYLRELGAAEIVDYKTAPVADQVLALHPEGIDVVLDTICADPAALNRLSRIVRPGGHVVTTQFTADPTELASREIVGVNLNNPASPELLALIADLIDAGKIRVRVEAQVPLEDAPQALARNKAGGARGKTAIEI
ncbi:NADP-dependent oxidoreductase [Nonomuraea sp. NPDC050536]|uniref:NADP-dependent oxidoreductase n=1 Tax=Nonomuraea sp. NPDC050536 TaxID=3364366 RepID=UPI0037C5314F